MTKKNRSLFNPLKVYRQNKDVVGYLYKLFSSEDKSVVVPYATHGYYCLPISYNKPIHLNFIDEGCYNYWSFLKTNQEKFLEINKLFLKPKDDKEAYYQVLERKYFSEPNPMFRVVIMSILSRTNENSNVFGGPHDIEYDDCFNDWYYQNVLNLELDNVSLSYNESFDNRHYFVQYVPKRDSTTFHETFRDGFDIEEYNRKRNCLLICEDYTECEDFKFYHKMDFKNLTLLFKAR